MGIWYNWHTKQNKKMGLRIGTILWRRVATGIMVLVSVGLAAHGGEARLRFEPVVGQSSHVACDRSGEPRGALEFDVARPIAGTGCALDAADFGVSPTNADNTTAFRAAFAAAKARRASRLMLQEGVYRVTEDSPLVLDGLCDFTFDGGGATFLAHRRRGPFLEVKDCTRIQLCNFTLDWDWSLSPLASLVEVAATDGRTVDLKFVHYDDFPDKDALFLCASSYDPVAKAVGLEGRFTRGFERIAVLKRGIDVKWVAPNVARTKAPGGGMKPGELYRLQHFYYHMGGVFMRSNAHLRIERVKVLSTPGHAFRISGTQHHTLFRDVDIVAPAGVPSRVITCTGDHLHLSGSRGFVKLENCAFSLGGDDIFNMHDNAGFSEKIAPATVRTFNAPYFTDVPPGTKIELRNADYSPVGGLHTVTSVKKLDGRTSEISFAEALPGDDGVGYILFDRRYDTRNVIVRGCRFYGNRGRGLLIAARDVTVENNVFRHHESGAIKIETGYTLKNWSEGYGVSNVVVRNNLFDMVNPSGRYEGHRQRSIYTGVYLKKDPSSETTAYPIVRDVLFAGNEFRDSTGVVAWLSCIQNVTFRDNLFADTVPRKMELPYRAQFYLDHARNVKIVNNVWRKSPCVASPGVEWNVDTCSDVVVCGNSLEECEVKP